MALLSTEQATEEMNTMISSLDQNILVRLPLARMQQNFKKNMQDFRNRQRQAFWGDQQLLTAGTHAWVHIKKFQTCMQIP